MDLHSLPWILNLRDLKATVVKRLSPRKFDQPIAVASAAFYYKLFLRKIKIENEEYHVHDDKTARKCVQKNYDNINALLQQFLTDVQMKTIYDVFELTFATENSFL